MTDDDTSAPVTLAAIRCNRCIGAVSLGVATGTDGQVVEEFTRATGMDVLAWESVVRPVG